MSEKMVQTAGFHTLPLRLRAIILRMNGWSLSVTANMEQLNIEYSVLSLSSPHFHFGDDEETEEIARRCNEYGADLRLRYPGKIGKRTETGRWSGRVRKSGKPLL